VASPDEAGRRMSAGNDGLEVLALQFPTW